jgi:hypothetical protein
MKRALTRRTGGEDLPGNRYRDPGVSDDHGLDIHGSPNRRRGAAGNMNQESSMPAEAGWKWDGNVRFGGTKLGQFEAVWGS